MCYNIDQAEEIIYRRSPQFNLKQIPKSDKILFVEALFRLNCVYDTKLGKPEWQVDAFKFFEFDIRHKNSLNEIAFLNF